MLVVLPLYDHCLSLLLLSLLLLLVVVVAAVVAAVVVVVAAVMLAHKLLRIMSKSCLVKLTIPQPGPGTPCRERSISPEKGNRKRGSSHEIT